MLPVAGSLEAEELRFHKSLVLLKMGGFKARNMLNWLELLINHYCCIQLVFISFISMMHGHTNIKLMFFVGMRANRMWTMSWPPQGHPIFCPRCWICFHKGRTSIRFML